MSDDELNAIEARANAATPGPWTQGEIAAGDLPYAGGCFAVEVFGATADPYAVLAECQHEADAAFIAAARTDIPALVAEVRRLRAVLGEPSPLEED
jgi:hypothetical protein